MAWLRREKTYDRTRLLGRAAEARKRGKLQKAIGYYREVLAVEPNDCDLHRRIAPLLADVKQPDQAWDSYSRAVDVMIGAGFVERAVGVLREAATRLPRHREAWTRLADAELKRNRTVDAHGVLLEGAGQLQGRRDVADAILLLRRAHKLAPRDFRTNYELAGALARSGAQRPAQALLEEMVAWTRGAPLRRVRGRQLRLSPTPGAFWRWLRAALTGR